MEYTGKVVYSETTRETIDQLINDFKGRSYGFT